MSIETDTPSPRELGWMWRGKIEKSVDNLEGSVSTLTTKVDLIRTETIPAIQTKLATTLTKIVVIGGIGLFVLNMLGAFGVALLVKWITKGL